MTTAPSENILWYWEDFPVGSVREFGAMRVTRADVLAFATPFDPQPFHLDDEAAKNSLFGKLSASRASVGLVLSKWETLNQHGVVVFSMQGWGMFGRRTPAAEAAP